MINIKDLKTGQVLLLVKRKYEKGIHVKESDEFTKVEIAKVGRRYVTLKNDVSSPTFDSQKDFKIGNGYKTMNYELYLSEKDYFNELQRSELLKEIKEFFNYLNYSRHLNMSLEDLEVIKKIIEKY